MKSLIYARVSTDTQELSQQLLACREYAQRKSLEVVHEFTDVGSGKDFLKRAGFDALLSSLRKGEAQCVIVFRIDRLGRHLQEMLQFFQEMENRGVVVYSLNENVDRETANGRLMLNIILSFAQYEREAISEATKERLAAMKAAGATLGRPRKTPPSTDPIRAKANKGGKAR